MNDNEKAATFTDWKPDHVCITPELGDRCVQMGHPKETHATPAPVMSDPRNYMRALENLDGYTLVKSSDGERVCRVFHNGDYQEEPTIIEALAALYDASKEPR